MEQQKIKLLVVIINRKLTEKVLADLKENLADFMQVYYGKGTARFEILNLLGDNQSEKTIITSFVKENDVEYVLNMLKTKYNFDKPGKGIAFTISLKSISGPLSYNILSSLI